MSARSDEILISKRRTHALIISVVVAALGYLGFSLWGGWEDILSALAMIGWSGTFIALALSMANYVIRFFRWQIYLGRLGHSVPSLLSFKIYLSGFALTTTPGKAGEAFRGVLLKHHDVPLSSTIAALISERISDMVAIMLLTMIGISQYPEGMYIVVAGAVGLGGLLICLASPTLLHRIHDWASSRDGKVYTLIAHTTHMLEKTRACHTPGLIIGSSLLALISWGAEAYAFYLTLEWLGADISFTFAVFTYAISMLAGAISFLPGGLGSSEAVMVSLLAVKGMATPAAVAATVFIRLATLWFAVVVGVIALYFSRREGGTAA